MATDKIVVVSKPTFIKNKHELAAMLKDLERGSRDAVALIVQVMNSTDEAITTKMKVDCAKSLLELQIKVSAEISKDQLTRQIAAIKLEGMNSAGNGETNIPMIDFCTVQDV